MPHAATQFRQSCYRARARALDLRPTSTARGYDSRWARFRTSYLAMHPLCRACGRAGRVTPACEVDHITPLTRGGAKYDTANLQSLCHACHAHKTWGERRDNVTADKGDMGGRK